MTFAQSHYALGIRGERAREARHIRLVLAEANAARRRHKMRRHFLDAIEAGFAHWTH